MKRTIVVGGAGFIGSHLSKMLKERDFDVSVYDLIDGNDIMDFEKLVDHAFGKDVIFDCAGILGSAETFDNIKKALEVNILGTLNSVQVAQRLDIPLIYLSLKNEWHNPYMLSKRAGTEICLMYAEYLGTKTAVLKGLNAYGPLQRWKHVHKALPTFVTRALDNKEIEIYGDGMQIVDMIYVRDLCEELIRMYERGTCWGRSIDGGTGIPITVNQLVNDIIREIGNKVLVKHIPMRKGEPPKAVALANPADARVLLDYYPETSWKEGLAKTINWYRENYKDFGASTVWDEIQ